MLSVVCGYCGFVCLGVIICVVVFVFLVFWFLVGLDDSVGGSEGMGSDARRGSLLVFV